MDHLTKDKFQQARSFVMDKGRPVDQARWRYFFEDGAAEDVWSALAPFQNDDDGFGHALEPDYRAPDSSVLATQTALHILHEVNTPADHPLLQGAYRFLNRTFDPDKRVWRFLPEGVSGYPHAPWWDQTRLAESFGGFVVNPRANILGHMLLDDLPMNEGIVRTIYLDVLDRFYNTDKAVDNNTIDCYRNLVDHLPNDEKARATDHLLQLSHLSLQTNPNEWHTYCLKPLDLVGEPAGPFYDTFEKLVDAHLDFEIGRQTDQGAWEPTWSWFGLFPDEWPAAQREWAGELTVNMVRKLQKFTRIDN